jgi:protein-S-isoprenylcysteine O-methyltransferase Ste14
MSQIKILSFLGYLLAVIGLIMLLYKHYIISANPAITVIQLLSFGLMIWARVTFKSRSFHLTANPTQGGLVTNGPYKWLRHPIYAAIIYFSFACFVGFPKIETLIYFALIFLGLTMRMILEENALVQEYPEYLAYKKTAKRLIPFIY